MTKTSSHPDKTNIASGLPQVDLDLVDDADEVLLTKAEVLQRVKLSFVNIWSLMQETPPRFPRARVAGDNKVVWLRSEINSWCKNRPLRRYRDDTDGVKMADSFRHEERKAKRKAVRAGSKKSGA